MVDRRLHLFSELLYININDPDTNNYYNSNSFYQVCYQFATLKATEDDKQLHQCLQSLVASYINEKYKRLNHEFQSSRKQFQSIRAHLTTIEVATLDAEIKRAFHYLPVELCPQDPYCTWEPTFSSQSMIKMVEIEFLVLTYGASLECHDNDEQEFNFMMALNKWLLAKATLTKSNDQQLINPLLQLFKTLLISNPMLLKNKAYTHYTTESRCAHYFLLYSMYRLRYLHDHSISSHKTIKIHWYKALLDLFLFIIHCVKYISNEKLCLEEILFDIVNMIELPELLTSEEIFIHTTQKEILRIIMDEYSQIDITSFDHFSQIVCNLFKNNQLNIIQFLYIDEHIQNLFHRMKIPSQIVDIMTANQKKKQLFQIFLYDASFAAWLANLDLLFILLQKRQCKLIKHLLKSVPSLIHRLDENGNDALLYVCLSVRGRRHRLVEYLISMGCDLQRKNLEGENFLDTLQLARNRELLRKLIEHEIIQIDNNAGEV